MKFQKIEIENFASYYGKHTIELETSKERPVVIFIGGTGFGKTSIFDAINWALYGTEYEDDLQKQRNKSIHDYVNESALKEVNGSLQKVSTSVTLFFENNQERYYITQKIGVIADSDGDKVYPIEKERYVSLKQISTSGDHTSIGYSSVFLDELLPNNVKNYFLFDGDRIYTLAQPGSSKEVQKAIKRVVDLEIIENSRDHLEKISTEFVREAKKAGKGELAKVEEDYSELLDTQKELKSSLKNTQSQIREVAEQITTLEERLANLPETEAVQNRINQINKRIAEIVEERKGLKIKLRSDLALSSQSLVLKDAKKLISIIDGKREKGEIPKHLSETFINDLIDLKKCICGTKFNNGDQIHSHLLHRLEIEGRKSEQDQGLLTLLVQLKHQWLNTVQESSKNALEKEDQIIQLDQEEKEQSLIIKELDKELDGLPQEDAQTLISKVRQRRTDKENFIRSEQEFKDRLSTLDEEISEIKKKRERLGKEQKRSHSLHIKGELALNAVKHIDEIYDEFAEESRLEVEKLTKEEFRKFVKSSSKYDVALTKDYELQVLDSNGNIALQRLSMGQSQCLSLAFITAISRVSEKSPPLVIDMPFSRLDPEVHENVSQRLTALTEQLILFLIPGVEWNDIAKKNLESKANHIYELEFKESVRKTEITKII